MKEQANKILEKYPVSIQQDIKDTLTAYSKVSITFYNGKFHIETGCMLLGEYPDDYQCYPDILATDIYTDDERVENYINNFCQGERKEYLINNAKAMLGIK